MFFTDLRCVACGTALAYDVASDRLVPAETVRLCRHSGAWNCNWAARQGGYECLACSLDRRTSTPGPDLTLFQAAKRRVIRQLHRNGIDPDHTAPPLRFELVRSSGTEKVTTGHEDGVVTLDVAEGDPARLTEVQVGLAEAYRTPVGHVRHECGHWHWQAFVASDPAVLDAFRTLFGDERLDYQMALQRHYASDDVGAWRGVYVSHYAMAHPWEDYAESFAHVLHMQAMLETARAEGFIPKEEGPASFADIYASWVPLTVGLNEMARSMGTEEPYPFAPPAQAVAKMAFVHGLLRS